MTQNNQDRVLFLYLRDKNEPRRVMTLARSRKDNHLTFSWSINKVTVEIEDKNTPTCSFFYKKVTVHDIFKKAMGRKISEARLGSVDKSITIELTEGERPLRAMLETLAGLNGKEENIPVPVQRLAVQALEKGLYLTKESPFSV